MNDNRASAEGAALFLPLSLFSSFPPFPPIPPFWKQFSFFFVSFLKSLPKGEGRRTKSPSILCLHVTSIYLCRRGDATCIPGALLSIWGCYLTWGGWAASPNLRLQCHLLQEAFLGAPRPLPGSHLNFPVLGGWRGSCYCSVAHL